MPSEGAWPKPSQLAVATGKGALQLAPDEQHPPSDKVARSEATQNVFHNASNTILGEQPLHRPLPAPPKSRNEAEFE